MRFQNPANGHIEEFGEATWLWVLVGGPFYLAYKQIWLHAVIAAVLSLLSAGLSWLLLYPLIIKWVIRSPRVCRRPQKGQTRRVRDARG